MVGMEKERNCAHWRPRHPIPRLENRPRGSSKSRESARSSNIAQWKILVCFESFFSLHKPIMGVSIDPAIWKTGVAGHTFAVLVLLVDDGVVAHHHPSHAGHLPTVTTNFNLPRSGRKTPAYASTYDHVKVQVCLIAGCELQLSDGPTDR